jgi:hypothetical protein
MHLQTAHRALPSPSQRGAGILGTDPLRARPENVYLIFLQVRRRHSEADAKTNFDLPVASWFFLRGPSGQSSETARP